MGWGIAVFAVVAMAAAAIAKLTGNLDKIIGFVTKYWPKKRELTAADRERLRRDLIDVVLGQVVKRLEDSLHHKIRLDLKRQEERQRVGRRDVSPFAQTTDRDAALQRRYRFQPADRLNLMRTLNGLPSATFDELMFTLQPPQGQVPGSSAAQGDRSTALLEWVESAEGQGLDKLCEVLELVGISPPQMAADTVEAKDLTDVSTHDLLKRDDINGRLLILGEPGAGKTNELLALAKTLLQQAKASAAAPIPVIFELSEWSGSPDKTFADWLCEQLKEKYTVPVAVAKDWIEHNQLWPLLDGLDELRRVDETEGVTDEDLDRQRQAKQIQCMRAINEFLDLHPATSAVVCCRRQEYAVLEAQGEYLKRLQGAITLQALDDEQIRTYFEKSHRGPLWDTLKNQPELLDLARSPLFLLMLLVAYQGQPIQNTNELLDLYIENQLNDLNNQGAYPPGKVPAKEQTHHYLAWLATKLEQQEVTEFLIERLQPSWLDRKSDRRFYRLVGGLIFGLIFGLMFGLSFGLIFGLIFGLSTSEAEIHNKQSPNQGIKTSIKTGLIVGLIFGLIGGLIFGLIGGLIVGPMFDVSIGQSGGWMFGLIFGLISGRMFGLIGGLIFGLASVIQHICLRFVLYRSGTSPWDYAKFLEHAENHRFIQRVGGRYRFVHDLLRKRFAARYQPRYR